MLYLLKKGGVVVSFDEAKADLQNKEAIQADAAQIEAWYGRNAYSEFLMKYGQRPAPKQAATIGQTIGMRVLASDGSMQPRQTLPQRQMAAALVAVRKERLRNRRQITALTRALSLLAENANSPEDAVAQVHPRFDEPIVRMHLKRAVEWLNRFAQEWDRHDDRADENIPEPPQEYCGSRE